MSNRNNPLDAIVNVLIPTFNRPDYLKRALDYYKKSGASFNFIIADSSNKPNKKINKKMISGYRGLKIRYLDNFPDTLTLHPKLTGAVKFVNSKYCVFCPDDDFIFPDAIRKSITFLESHPDYSAAHGTYLGYHLVNIPFLPKKVWLKIRYMPHTISKANPLERIDSHMKDYILVLWAVRRTTMVKKIYAEFNKLDINPYLLPNLGELIPDVLTVVFGKVKNLNILYGVRQYFGSIAIYYPSFIDAKKASKYAKGYNDFKKCLLKNLPKSNKLDYDKAAATIDLAMEKYIIYSFHEHFMNRVNLVLRHFPEFVSKALRQMHALYLFSKKEDGQANKLINKSSKYFKDLSIIKKSILNSNI